MPRQATPLTDTKIKALRPKLARYRVSDTGGLLLEVMPSGSKVWRYRYQLHSVRYPALTIGNYPEISLADARKQRDEWAALVARGESPRKAVAASKAEKLNTIQAFAAEWFREQISDKSDSYSRNVERVLNKDVFPKLGRMPLTELTPGDVMALCDHIKSRGSPKMALFSRNVLSICRQRWDIGHELGHFVLHAGIVTGDRVTEGQANRFAGALLIPRTMMAKHFPRPRGSRLDWQGLSEFKLSWKVSKAAILYRARQLELISEDQYKTGAITLRRTGEATGEREDRLIELEGPELVAKAFSLLAEKKSIYAEDIAESLRISATMLRNLVGFDMPARPPGTARPAMRPTLQLVG